MVDVLPESRARRHVTGLVYANGMTWQPIFCANCGAPGGVVPEDNCTFAFYLCNPCHEKHGTVAGTYAMPDDEFFSLVQAAQIEHYGRILSPLEQLAALDDETSPLAKLAKDRSNKEK